MRITDVESHSIRPPYHDFNAHTLERYHGPNFQSRTIYVLHTDSGLQGIGETLGHGHDAEMLREKCIGTDPFDWINAAADLGLRLRPSRSGWATPPTRSPRRRRPRRRRPR